ncbi:MAG: hypothetical protein KC492_29330 [Myxococcales bacterium]|nr:hypothetical protein [Myxococcales bacterium]
MRRPLPPEKRRATARPRPHQTHVRPLWECRVCATWWAENIDTCRECGTHRGAGVQLDLEGVQSA